MDNAEVNTRSQKEKHEANTGRLSRITNMADVSLCYVVWLSYVVLTVVVLFD